MTTTRSLGALVATVLMAGTVHTGLGSLAPAGAAPARCGNNGPFISDIRTTKVRCPKAKAVSSAWARESFDDETATRDNDIRVEGFRCRFPRTDSPFLPVTCKDGRRVVKFTYNS